MIAATLVELGETAATWADAELAAPGCSVAWDAQGGPAWLADRPNATIVITRAMTNLKDIVFETDHYWVKRVPKGFEVYKTGLTHSTRVAVIGYTGDKGLQRAKLEIERREAASGPAERHHATKKKSSAQLDREIEAFLQGRVHAPNMPHAIPDRGYMVAQHGGGTYP